MEILSVRGVLPEHTYPQEEITDAFARVIADGDGAAAGAAHRDAVRRLLGRHLRHTWVTASLSRRPEVVDAGIRAAGRSQHVFDSLVEIGLGDGRITPRLTAGLASGLVAGLASHPPQLARR